MENNEKTITELEHEIEILKAENDVLRQLIPDKLDHVGMQQIIAQYKMLIDELSEIKAQYKKALQDVYRVKMQYKVEMDKLLADMRAKIKR